MIPTIITHGIFAILISRYYPFIVIVNYGVRIHYSWDNHSHLIHLRVKLAHSCEIVIYHLYPCYITICGITIVSYIP